MVRLLQKLLLVGTLFVAVPVAFGFPEMARHGYANCVTCHFSPNGGGVLTPYGRVLSQELLSTWSAAEEGSFAYGLVKTPDWLALGGDFRAIQTYENTPLYEMGKFILMQIDAEGALTWDKFQLVGTLGRQEPTSYNKAGGTIFSRRHYLTYRPWDEFSVRVGRFGPAYGINIADHIFVTKRSLGFDEGSDSYNFELAWQNDDYDVFVSGVFEDSSRSRLYRGGIIRAGYHFSERYVVGASYFLGANDSGKRHLLGPYAILGFSKKLYLLAEIDFPRLELNSGVNRWGIVDYLRLNYEVFKGVVAFATQEYSQGDLDDPKTRWQGYGLGVQWFPRPHFEFQLFGQKKKLAGGDFTDTAWFLMHYYL